MPRKARLFVASSGSVVRGFLKFSANIPTPLDSKRQGFAQTARTGDRASIWRSETS
jgi:hypothetical protein